MSLKTVSRFVNGETNIDSAIAGRIAEAIAALHFRRNLAAASIRPGQRSQLVGLIIEDVSNPFYAALTRSMELALRASGRLLLAASSEENSDRFCRLVEQLIERRVDGLVVIPPTDPGPRWAGLAAEIPALVLLDRVDPDIDADSIVADDEAGGREGTALLIAGGARRIAFVGEALAVPTIAGRYQGFRSALAEAALAVHPELVVDGVRSTDDVCARSPRCWSRASTSTASSRPTTGRRWACCGPSGMSGSAGALVGFDDFEAATLVEPAVTVVTHSVTDMGRLAAELLQRRIDGLREPARRLVLPVTAIRRGSDSRRSGAGRPSGNAPGGTTASWA